MRTPFTPIKVISQTFELIDLNRKHAPEIKIPVLLCLANQDHVIDNRAAEEFFQQLPNSKNRIKKFERSAHAILADYESKNVTQEISDFLSKLESAHQD